MNIKIISPHIDDAFLSLGGSILKWIENDYKIKIYNVFTLSNSTTLDSISGNNYCLDVDQISTIRKKEEEEVSKKIKFDYEFWDFLDLPLRQHFNEMTNKALEKEILDKISQCINHDDLLFLPLGIGHKDHIFINKICRKLVSKKENLFFYEDMPHLCWSNIGYEKMFQKLCKTNTPIYERISFNKKQNILLNYSSQVSSVWLNSMKTYAYNPVDNGFYERYWCANSENIRQPISKTRS